MKKFSKVFAIIAILTLVAFAAVACSSGGGGGSSSTRGPKEPTVKEPIIFDLVEILGDDGTLEVEISEAEWSPGYQGNILTSTWLKNDKGVAIALKVGDKLEKDMEFTVKRKGNDTRKIDLIEFELVDIAEAAGWWHKLGAEDDSDIMDWADVTPPSAKLTGKHTTEVLSLSAASSAAKLESLTFKVEDSTRGVGKGYPNGDDPIVVFTKFIVTYTPK